jgi:hypothetical protein
MPQTPKTVIIAGLAYVLLFAGAGAGIVERDKDDKCGGVERWDQKVVIDDEADNINTTPVITTIKEMNAISTADLEIKKNTERQEIEKQVYTIKDCFITHAIRESDNDIHLVIEDGEKHTMIAEIPDTKCKDARKSEFIEDFRKARKTFLKFQNVYNHRKFDITGVLFVDKEHSKPPTGNAKNNIELHPVIDLKSVSKF